MDESEKTMALKKAYAEVILNTAKEAAARVFASERRALRFQHDLNATKEESLQMLLRLRQMIDSESTEAEITWISQRRRIEELEARLGKTEDKILELREQLKNTTNELHNQKKHELQLHDSCKTTEIAVTDETPQTIVPYSSDSDLESFKKTDKGASGRPRKPGKKNLSHLESYLSHGSDVASLIMGSAEAELSRNGCTQRVRAFKDEGRVLVRKRKRSMTRRKRSLSGKKTEMDNRAEVQELPDVSEQHRILRYTLRGMRKKETSSCCDENLEDSKESVSNNECSRDSRRLAQVARQLISLSGKKWR